MTPDFLLKANDIDFTDKIRNRLLRLVINDHSGIKSDNLSLSIADHDGKIAIPRQGAKLDCYLGWVGRDLIHMGEYIVDTSGYLLSPNKIIIKAKAANVFLGSKEKVLRSRSFDQTTLGAVVNAVASDMGLQAAISAELNSIDVGHVDQTDESNLHFLTRLASQYDATAKPAGGKLVFVKKNTGKSASGIVLPSHLLSLSDIQPNANWKDEGRGQYGGVQARWHDTHKAESQLEKVGNAPFKKIRGNFATGLEAKAAINAELERLQRDQTRFDFTLKRGNPLFRADAYVVTDATFTKDILVNKRWLVKTCTHTLLKDNGYTTKVTTTGSGSLTS